MYSKKLSEYKVGIKLDKDPLGVEQNNYASKTVKAQIVKWLRCFAKKSSKQFGIGKLFFCGTKIVK